ncbi:MAG: hypothetical protein M1817_002342 [Caeruleum heppii]|nr:MAG: hypothetical protein M1817_003473 [Caeruleum heppii]KAI9673704.1 MAG: hypothetical protein M1817_002342 [Caeruleum heppii]
MSGAIEALSIFDQHHNLILSHTYRSRPPSASTILPLYLAHTSPRPPLLYLPSTTPPTVLFSLSSPPLLILSPVTTLSTDPLLILEFLHHVLAVLEEFLGAPLLPAKIESNYEVVAQVLDQMCDGGLVNCTEGGVLRDVVDVPGWMGRLLGGVGLPGSTLSSSSTPSLSSLQPSIPHPSSSSSSNLAPAIPWRRPNIRHTSNELYVDILESLSVTLAPSGRPLAAFAHGSIAFTSKISGVPELLLVLSAPGGGNGKNGIANLVEWPVFHPCVRLARWRDQPGELSFVPPDGKFALMGYEVDLLPFTSGKSGSAASNVRLPVSVEIRTGLGPSGADFEVRLLLSNTFHTAKSSTSSSSSSIPFSTSTSINPLTSSSSSTNTQPTIEDLLLTIPIPPSVRTISDLRATRGEAVYAPSEHLLEWRIPSKPSVQAGGGATLRCTVVGPVDQTESPVDNEEGEEADEEIPRPQDSHDTPSGYSYDPSRDADRLPSGSYQSLSSPLPSPPTKPLTKTTKSLPTKSSSTPSTPMPTSLTLSFTTKNYLASGLKVEKLTVDHRRSRGLGEGVRPYKGVRYVTVSKGGVECRC